MGVPNSSILELKQDGPRRGKLRLGPMTRHWCTKCGRSRNTARRILETRKYISRKPLQPPSPIALVSDERKELENFVPTRLSYGYKLKSPNQCFVHFKKHFTEICRHTPAPARQEHDCASNVSQTERQRRRQRRSDVAAKLLADQSSAVRARANLGGTARITKQQWARRYDVR